MKIVVKEPFKTYEVRTVEKGYRTYSDLVGGGIEIIDIYVPGLKNIVVVNNDNGKWDKLPANLKFNDPRIEDIFCGTVFFCKEKMTEDGAELDGLTDEEVEHLLLVLPYLFKSFTPEESAEIDPEDYAEIVFISFN